MSLTREQKHKARSYQNKGLVESITPDDRNDLDVTIEKLYVGTGGDLKIDTTEDQTITLKNIPNGTLIDFVMIKKIHLRGTTASDLVAIH
tara:strand:+ start:958 stop:1227 length:270 start_codon:yes stop_codon:yes gene_type:complete